MSGCRMRIMGRTRCYHADSVLSVTRFASSAPARSFLPSVSLSAEATRRRERSVEFSSMASAPPHSHRLLKKPPLVLISSLGRELEGVVPISARRCPGGTWPGRRGSRANYTSISFIMKYCMAGLGCFSRRESPQAWGKLFRWPGPDYYTQATRVVTLSGEFLKSGIPHPIPSQVAQAAESR